MVTGNPLAQLEVIQGRVKVLVQGHRSPQPKCWHRATLSLVGLSPATHLVKNLVSLPSWDTLGGTVLKGKQAKEKALKLRAVRGKNRPIDRS